VPPDDSFIATEGGATPARQRPFRDGALLIKELVSRQKLNFTIAVSGAAVFATFTAGSSLGGQRWQLGAP
jgi:hypothetical protein